MCHLFTSKTSISAVNFIHIAEVQVYEHTLNNGLLVGYYWMVATKAGLIPGGLGYINGYRLTASLLCVYSIRQCILYMLDTEKGGKQRLAMADVDLISHCNGS